MQWQNVNCSFRYLCDSKNRSDVEHSCFGFWGLGFLEQNGAQCLPYELGQCFSKWWTTISRSADLAGKPKQNYTG